MSATGTSRFARPPRRLLRAAARSVALAITAAALIVSSGCASVERPSWSKPLNLRLDAGKSAEECLTLDAAARIAWRFESTASVDFNVHFHRGRDLVTPVERLRTRTDSGTFSAPIAESYCLMWMNASAIPAFVSGELQRPLR